MPSNPSAIEISARATMSRAPAQAGFDVSDLQLGARAVQDTIPYQIPDPAFTQVDPLAGFLCQSDTRPAKTEAERVGADRFGGAWPMMRAQRLHSGDSHVTEAVMRRLYAHSRIGVLFTPLEMPQDPAQIYRADPNEAASGRKRGGRLW